jgi:Trk-type K+ transport system membrane component
MSNHTRRALSELARDDRILPATKVALIIVVPFLVLAFLILYFFPEDSGERFAWAIKPAMTALFIGAGYLGGGYQFVRLILGREWHRYGMAFPPVVTFTVAMLAATLLHWDRFDIHHFPFQLWLVLYIVTPFLITGLWWTNRRTDPVAPEPGDPLLPRAANFAFGALGVVTLIAALTVFVKPQLAIGVWSWTLTPLTARVLAGWFALMGVGSLVLARERRWSACRVALQSFMLWHGLVLAGAFWHEQDFGKRGLMNGYVLATVTGLAGMGALYLLMEARSRAAAKFSGASA